MYANENSQTLYVKNIQTILDNIDLSFIFRNQIPVNIIWIKTHVKQILIDQFIQIGVQRLVIPLVVIFILFSSKSFA